MAAAPHVQDAGSIGASRGSSHWLSRIALRVFRRPLLIPLDEIVEREAVDAFLERAIRRSSAMYVDVSVVRRELDLAAIHPLSRIIESDRIGTASRLIRWSRKRGIPLFEPLCFRQPGERGYRVILPPVVEPANGDYAVIDGVHRLFVARRLPVLSAALLVIASDEMPPLPAELASWSQVAYRQGKPKKKRKFGRRWRPDRFRPAASYLRSHLFVFASLQAVRAECQEARLLRSQPVTETWCKKHDKLDSCGMQGGSSRMLRSDADRQIA